MSAEKDHSKVVGSASIKLFALDDEWQPCRLLLPVTDGMVFANNPYGTLANNSQKKSGCYLQSSPSR